jgi:hypothetical protein
MLKEKDIDIKVLVASNIKAKINEAREDRNSQTSLDFYKENQEKIIRSFDNSKSPNVFDRLSKISRPNKIDPVRGFKKRANNSMLEQSPTLFDWQNDRKLANHAYQQNSVTELNNERFGRASVVSVKRDVRLKKYNATMNKFYQSQPKMPNVTESVEKLKLELQQLQDLSKAMQARQDEIKSKLSVKSKIVLKSLKIKKAN